VIFAALAVPCFWILVAALMAPCRNHDGEEVVAIDISGKIEENDEDDHLVTHEATSAASGDGMALLHCAMIAATVAEYVRGG
jgi:hypothetical protein